MPIVDKTGRLLAILAGQPGNSDWLLLQMQASQALERLRPRCHVPKGQHCHRRGAFVALRCGISHRGGQTSPKNLTNHPMNEKVLAEINGMGAFQRIASFASGVLFETTAPLSPNPPTGVMANWAPALYKHYGEKLDELCARDFSLLRTFPSTIFAATTYNLGPRTVCYKHKDFANLAYGLCSVTSLGQFDPTKGGHLILWELGIVVEFPPGSTILLASALITHSNTTIGKDETRYSAAHYSAGALFRWAENGFQRTEDLYNSIPQSTCENLEFLDSFLWEHGLSLLPTFPVRVAE